MRVGSPPAVDLTRGAWQTRRAMLSAIYQALAAYHPVLPFAILAVALHVLDRALDKFGLTDRYRAALPFGGALADLADRLPTVIVGAAWAAFTSGEPDTIEMAVYGAVSAVVIPVLAEAKKHARILLALAVGWLSGCGLFASPKPPEFSARESECLMLAEARADAKLAACGDSVEGDCSTDAIVSAQEIEALECLEE